MINLITKIKVFAKIIKPFIKFLFLLLDTLIWIKIKVLPSNRLIIILKKRPFKKITFFKNKKLKNFIKAELINYFRIRESKGNFMSSCLSRSLLGRYLFDLLNINNELWFGIIKNKKGLKNAHAWLHDPTREIDITNSLVRFNCVSLFKM